MASGGSHLGSYAASAARACLSSSVPRYFVFLGVVLSTLPIVANVFLAVGALAFPSVDALLAFGAGACLIGLIATSFNT